ncbi:MAG: peptidylprolyl isomerase [Aeoliella sp.]
MIVTPASAKIRWAAIAGLLLCLPFAAPNSAQAAEVTHKIRMYWDFGEIEVDLYGEDSPRHVANFLRYVDTGAYDFSYSHRSRSGSLRFIQGGSFYFPTPFFPGAMHLNTVEPEFGTIKNEFDASNGLSNTPRTLSAARRTGLDTASAGWFFNVTNNAAGFDPGPYTVFGEVSSGWDLFGQLPNLPTAGNIYGNGVNSGVATAPLANFGSPSSPLWEPPIFHKWVRIPTTVGDFNLDGLVNAADEAVWQAGQGSFSTANLTADANGDRVVDGADLTIMQQNLGSGTLNDLAGDYNSNGVVGVADQLWWATTLGSTITLDADGNNDGTVDAADYTLWRNHLGAGAAASLQNGSTSVPEPASIVVALLSGAAACAAWRTHKKSGPRMSQTHADKV